MGRWSEAVWGGGRTALPELLVVRHARAVAAEDVRADGREDGLRREGQQAGAPEVGESEGVEHGLRSQAARLRIVELHSDRHSASCSCSGRKARPFSVGAVNSISPGGPPPLPD